MSSRSGSENRRRKIVVPVRVDEAEKDLLDQAAKRQGLSVPELLRRNAFSRAGVTPAVVSQNQRKSISPCLRGHKDDIDERQVDLPP